MNIFFMGANWEAFDCYRFTSHVLLHQMKPIDNLTKGDSSMKSRAIILVLLFSVLLSPQSLLAQDVQPGIDLFATPANGTSYDDLYRAKISYISYKEIKSVEALPKYLANLKKTVGERLYGKSRE